jgi:uncharacterized protein (DUF302 family)
VDESLVFEVVLPLPYEKAMNAVEDAFKLEGFGFLTHVDVRTILKEKLNEEFRPFSIIGVCKPTLAHRLLTAEPKMGLLLPCKVTVEAAEEGHSKVRMINPQNMLVLDFSDDPEIEKVVQEAEASIRRVLKALEELKV